MAVVNNFNFDPNRKQDDEETQGGQTHFVNKPIGISGVSAPDANNGVNKSAAPTVGQGSSNQSNPTSSGRFTNLTNYLDANKSYNQQGGGLAGQVINQFQNQSGAVQNSLKTADGQFKDQAAQANINYDPNTVNQAISDPYAYLNPNKEATIPTTGNTNLDNFTKLRDAKYTGPTTLDTDYNLRGQADNLKSTTDLTGNEGGRFALLSKMFGRPTYNNGSQRLDNLLLQGNKDQLSQLQGSRSIASDLTHNINNTIGQDELLADKYARDTQATSDRTRNALFSTDEANLGAIPQFDNYAQGLVDNYNSKTSALQQNAIKSQAANAISKSDADALGITTGTPVWNIHDFSKYLTPTDFTANKRNVISQDDLNKIQALNVLAGNTASGTSSSILDAFKNDDSVGLAAKQSPYSMNKDLFNTDISNIKGEYNDKVKDQMEKYNKSWDGMNVGGVPRSNMIPGYDLQNDPVAYTNYLQTTQIPQLNQIISEMNRKNDEYTAEGKRTGNIAAYPSNNDFTQRRNNAQYQLNAAQNLINSLGTLQNTYTPNRNIEQFLSDYGDVATPQTGPGAPGTIRYT